MGDQKLYGKVTRRIDMLANVSLDAASKACFEAQEGGLFYIPIVLIAAVKEGDPMPTLVASTCMFGRQQPLPEIAKLLRITAAHLVCDEPEEESTGVLTTGGMKLS